MSVNDKIQKIKTSIDFQIDRLTIVSVKAKPYVLQFNIFNDSDGNPLNEVKIDSKNEIEQIINYYKKDFIIEDLTNKETLDNFPVYLICLVKL